MVRTAAFVVMLYMCTCGYGSTEDDNGASWREWPRVLMSVNARNEEHTLPTFFAYIDALYYPKHRMSIWIQTDHNEDNTSAIINQWVSKTRHLYHRVHVRNKVKPTHYQDAEGKPCKYTNSRYRQLLMNLQRSVEEARSQWADYWFYVSAGNFLLERNVLFDLIMEGKTVVAPMLELFYDGAYSNFWAAADEHGYYKSVPEYFQILERKINGTIEVPMVHSTFLIDMRDIRVDSLQFWPIPTQYKGHIDDVIIFAWSVHKANLTMYLCNKKQYGFMMDAYNETMTLKERHTIFTDVFVDYVAFNDPPLPRSEFIKHTYPMATKKGFDEVFMINLDRRPDRRRKMELSLKELGIEFRHYSAVDGRNFTPEKLKDMGITAMTEFRDPFLERPITFGEIGCFLSHYNIWVEMIERGLDMVMVLEDDVRFESDFNVMLETAMTEAREALARGVEWDLIYLGRKPLITKEPELFVDGFDHLVWVKYSYWTLGYVIRLSGAKQLVEGKPLSKLIPVDEYLPVKFNEHSNEDLLKSYYPRELIAFSFEPLLIYPTHYVGDPGHFSDTDDTLSFKGENVEHFKGLKIAQIEKQRQMEMEEDEKEKEMRKKEFEEQKEKEKLAAQSEATAVDSTSPLEGSILDEQRPRDEL